MSAPTPLLTPERRARLRAAVLGAAPNLLVTVKAGDLKACLGVAEAVDDARQLVGENDELRRRLQVQTAIANDVPILRDRLTAALARNAELEHRIDTGVKLLRGQG